ncbi:HNH endonuclease signature motif containing protein [Nocardioides daejeonensis]|uniref:HNH endonuclease signature motif containing protein n=1 Tax=Nocardioides daejeonensis TaxID=1046556 RepID=UPI000D746B6A|nr:HNH endonuclease signature motif containing protein [Nocardioides daejeonensis]
MLEIDARHQPYEVTDLDGGTLLGLVSEDRFRELGAARRKLRLAYRWAVLNPPTPDHPRATFGDQILYPNDTDVKMSGEGTPDVALFAVEEFSAAAGCSRAAALNLIADTLDLHHRLPRLWAKVEDLTVPGWKARRVAEITRNLSFEAVRWFDTELAATGLVGWPTIEKTLAYATVKFHPELFKDPKAPKTKDDWGVWVNHPQARDGSIDVAVGGTSDLTARGDSLDLARFLDLLTDEANQLAALGDTDTLNQRRAKAIGRLVDDSQDTLDLFGAGEAHDGRGSDGGAAGEDPGSAAGSPSDAAGGPVARTQVKPGRGLRVFAHLSLTDLLDLTGAHDIEIASTDRLGQILIGQLRDWLQRHGSVATITPVIDMNRGNSDGGPGRDGPDGPGGSGSPGPSHGPVQGHGSGPRGTRAPRVGDWVDRHDPPAWMAQLVRLRDPCCVYPGCTKSSWDADLDHIEPYVPPDDGGPPGQTRPDNLAPLCRRHHLVKTVGRWRYERLTGGSYLWTNHHNQRWLVTPDTSRPLQ